MMPDRENVRDGLRDLAEFLEAKQNIAGVGKGAEIFGWWAFCVRETLRGQEPVEPEWISVKDRLPESNEEVLVAVYESDGRAYQIIAVHYPDGDWDSEDTYFCMNEDEVRFWMPLPPLPEPPEEVSGDG